MAVDYSDIAKYFSGPNRPGPGAVDIAKFILLNADVKRQPVQQQSTNSPSLMSRIFDIISRPNYAVANFVKGAVHGNPDIKDFFSGLSGTQKTTFSKVLEEAGMPPSAGRAALGFGLDVAADPVSYIPVGGAASKIASLVKGSTKESVVPTLSKLQQVLNKGEPVNPELFGLSGKVKAKVPTALLPAIDKTPTPVKLPKDVLAPELPSSTKIPVGQQLPLELPGVPTKYNLPPAIEKVIAESAPKEVKGQLAFNLPKETAAEIVTKIASNDSSAILKTMPRPGVAFEPRHQAAADEIIKNFDPAKATAQINQKFPDTLNAKQQVKLYYRAIDAAKRMAKKPEWVASHANKIYAAVEKTMQERGFVPRIGTGENVKLSDVIQQMGGAQQAKQVLDHFARDVTPDSPVYDAIQGLRAANAIDESKSVKFIADKVAESKAAIENSGALSDAGVKNFNEFLKNFGKKAASSVEISPASVQATHKLIDYITNSGKTSAQVAIEQKARMIDEIVSKGRGSRVELNGAVTRGLESNLGRLPTWVADQNHAVEFFMGRVATWWGQKDLRPFSLNAIGSSAATAAARGQVLHSLFKDYNQLQRHEALGIVQGYRQATSPETARLADEVTKMMSNLVGTARGNSVILRSAIDRDLLNKWMRTYKIGFDFTNGKVKDITGKIIDYSKGTDWLNSWKTAVVTSDPEQFLFKLQQAMEQATREKALFDELGERFAAKVPGGSFRTKLDGYPYLEGYYFTDDIAKQLPRVIKDWTHPTTLSNPLMKHYDKLLSMWKSGVTIYRPAHHLRNLIGDAYLGWMDGVNTVRPYILAARVQRTLKGMYPTLSDVDKLVELGVASRNMGTPKVGEIIFRNKSGVPFTAEQIAAVAHQKGLLEHARTIEDIIDLSNTGRFQPFGGKVQGAARSASELISHNSRLAHFIDKVIKSRGSNLSDIFEQASRRARKWHPTGLDLTDFERKVLRRIIPFYSWLRKSTPLLIEGLVMHPGKAVTISKLYGSIQESQGIDTPGRADPFPVDQMFPSWLRAEGLGPLGKPDSFLGKLSNQDPSGYVMLGQGLNPLTQLMSQVQQPGQTLLSGLTPVAQVPLALSTGTNLFTKAPISGPDAAPGAMQEYIGSQIPVWSAIQNIAGVTPFGTQTKKATKSDQATEGIVNWLSGLGVKGTGPYIKQGIYEYKNPARLQRTANKQNFLQYLQGQTG